jgi:hypothetical protein
MSGDYHVPANIQALVCDDMFPRLWHLNSRTRHTTKRGGESMKRVATAIFGLAILLSLSFGAIAQDSTTGTTKSDKKVAKAEKKEAKASEKGKALSLTGWVKSEGDKVTFVNDKDKQSWNVQNADTLKAHDGKHVKVKATLNESDHSIMVDSVKEMAKRKQAKAKS